MIVTQKLIFVVLFLLTISVFVGILITPNLIRYFDCQQAINYLQETKEFVPSDAPADIQTRSIIDNEIQKIRETQTCSFPIFISARMTKISGNEDAFWIDAEWIQKERNSREIKKMNVRFKYEQKEKEFRFDVIPSGIAKFEDSFYADAFYVCFVSDPNDANEYISYFLPYEYSDGLVYVSLTDDKGNSTNWLKCEVVKYSN